MRVPFLDLHAQHRPLRAELRAAVEAVIDGSGFILGPAVERFERHFADYVGVRHCVGLNSGTSALHLALLACGVGPGDEVITTPHTWISTTWAISYVGARPVYADVDPVTFALDPAQVERAVTPRTRAVLPVHLYGQTADLGGLASIAERHGLVLIEDAAQAHGARYQSRRAGSLGALACFSFYPGKNLGAFGEAGAVVTDDDALAGRVRRLRDHAQQGRHHHVEVGFNARMEGVQGAVLDVKLRHLDSWNEARARHARCYAELLADVPGLLLPAARTPNGHVWHLYVVRVPAQARQRVIDRLSAAGVGTGVHYPTLVPFQPAYAHLGYRPGAFPVAEAVAGSCLSLPMYPELTEGQLRHVAAALREALADACAGPTARAA
jgi:dTDP-4-amino-4,6-dideoxygalactose transaminase